VACPQANEEVNIREKSFNYILITFALLILFLFVFFSSFYKLQHWKRKESREIGEKANKKPHIVYSYH